MVRSVGVLLLLIVATSALAQPPEGVLVVEVRAGGAPVAQAEVVVASVTHRTNASGLVTIAVAAGPVDVVVAKAGFAPTTVSIVVSAGQEQRLVVELQEQPKVEETITVVAATRTDKRLEDQPMRVEVLAREEIEEKMLMTPGDIVMMLNEMGGMRVQATSPSLGAASVRIQGMRGRYTRILSDGLPLFGAQVGGLGLLQIPPMDLGQVEVIKGVASALYGAGAIGGVVNLLSRRPGAKAAQEFLVNRSTRGATDAVAFVTAPIGPTWSVSLLADGHWQERTDVDGDAWADLSGYSRAVVRPRIFWNGSGGRSFFATAGATYEDRSGGTLDGRVLGSTGLPYRENLETTRWDAGALGQFVLGSRYVLTTRMAVAQQRHDHLFGEVRERDRHLTTFGEVALRWASGRHTWVAGAAAEHEGYEPRDVPRMRYAFTVPGAFLQYDVDVSRAVSVSSSARLDVHSEFGAFVSPRLSALLRAGRWTSRVSIGGGFFGPTPLTEETEAAGLSRLQIPRPLEAERGQSGSFDLSRTDGPASYTFTAFASRVSHPIFVERSEFFELTNLPSATTNVGFEVLGTVRRKALSVTATYTYVRSRDTADGVGSDVPLTPRHSTGLVGMWEAEGVGRIGVEWYYTGQQRLEENPYRTASRPYTIVGLLAERQFGRVRLFVNGENLAGVRQSRWDPLLRPSRSVDGRWTVDAWAPLEGRTINGGIRVGF